MILQRLAEHYDRLAASSDEDNQLAPTGFSRQKISFCIVLEPDGRLNQFQSLQEKKGKLNVATGMIVPGQAKSSGATPNSCFLWDNASYMLGWKVDADKLPRAQLEFETFRTKHLELEQVIADSRFSAVCAFLRNWSPDQSLQYQEQLEEVATNFGVFRIAGEMQYVHEIVSLPKAYEGSEEEIEDDDAESSDQIADMYGTCLVTGAEGVIARLHEPPIKGVTGAKGSGAKIVSFDKKAFRSYGKPQSYNAPVLKVVSEKYATVLNHLLERRDRRIQLGDSTVVYWADHAHPMENAMSDLFAETYLGDEAAPEESKERIRQARIYLTQMRDGTQESEIVDDGYPTKFFMLGLSPNASRLSVRLWVEADVIELQRRLGQHLRDIALEDSREDRPLTMRRIADATGRAIEEKGKRLKFDTKVTSPQLAGDLARSVLMGAAYPQSLLTTMLRRIRSDGEVVYARVAAIKGCLARNSRLRGNPLEVSIMLDKNNTDPAYCCGRAFSLLEKIQHESVEGELNRTIKDSYFSSASATPALVFPRLCRLSQHHLAKLPTGLRITRERGLGEVLGKLIAFPRHLPIEDQGKFVLGYFHQRQDLFTSKKDKAEGASE